MIVLSNPAHPWHTSLQKESQNCHTLEDASENWGEFLSEICQGGGVVFDFSFFEHRQKKEDLIAAIGKFDGVALVSDLSCYWGDMLVKRYPHLAGAVAGAFYSPENGCEYFVRESCRERVKPSIVDVLQKVGRRGVSVSSPGIGFIYPRTLATIINEAWFALDEGLATSEAIDTALKYGVNHPIGPFEWTQKIGADKVVALLNELYCVTGDPRYRVCPRLKLELEGERC